MSSGTHILRGDVLMSRSRCDAPAADFAIIRVGDNGTAMLLPTQTKTDSWTGVRPGTPTSAAIHAANSSHDRLRSDTARRAFTARDAHHARPQIYIRRLGIMGAVSQSGHALKPHAGVQEQPEDGEVAPVAEILARAVRQQSPHIVNGQHRDELLRDHRGRVLAIGEVVTSPSSSSHLKSCWSDLYRVAADEGLGPLQLSPDEGFYVLTADAACRGGHALDGQER